MSRELVWVDESIAAQIEIVSDIVRTNKTSIEDAVKKITDDADAISENLEENLIKFRYHAQQTREKYKQVVSEELEATYKVWEECEKLRDEAYEKLSSLTGSIKTVKPQLDEIVEEIHDIKEALSSANIYGADHLYEVIRKFNELTDEEKQQFKTLLSR
ncbi:hypothetical protein SDC9_46812 [bioreactor metagenome]|uniref:Chromosome partition protein Smc n=1 Tax=bioreactor metagenome TaxID=1076179 RepID=A0A644W9T5_9ZZZZ